MRTNRQFTREFKLSILKELETKKLAEICREHNLAHSTVCGWKNDYVNNPNEAFKGQGNLWKLEAKLAERERLIGELYAENSFLKKAYEKLKLCLAEERRKR